MSKVTITLELDRYICSELSDVRAMIKDLDFSGLSATVERIQRHADAMEDAIRNYNNYMRDIKDVLDGRQVGGEDIKRTNKQKLDAIKEILSKKYKEW